MITEEERINLQSTSAPMDVGGKIVRFLVYPFLLTSVSQWSLVSVWTMITTAGLWQVLVKHIDYLVIARLVMAALRNGGKTVPHALGQAFDHQKSFPAGGLETER